jgi:uncharacterized protein
MRPHLLAMTLLLILGSAVSLHADEAAPPKLYGYVTDQTGTLSDGEKQLLTARLRAFEDSTSTQIVVLMVPTTGDMSLEEYSLKVAELNKIGQKGKSNGALLFIAKDDHKVRIEVGYGLEGVLTDALTSIIIRREIAPQFRQSDYFAGISAATDAMMLASRGEYKADPKSGANNSLPIIPIIIFIVIFILVIRNASRRPHRYFGGFGPTMWTGSSGGGWGGGGSSSFGGGSSFSGGGGSFGGGGASGSW